MTTEENFINRQNAFQESLKNIEANNRLLQFVQILMQINQREKLVKYPLYDQGNPNNACKRK